MKESLKAAIAAALGSMGVTEMPEIEIQVPREEGFGDLSSPVAMGLARTLRKSPKAIAEDIRANLPDAGMFSEVNIDGPGFLNFRFRPEFLHEGLRNVLSNGAATLRSDVGQGKRVQVEYVSANPTGPLHLGHGRGAALGHAVANLLEAAGFGVEREYYINDAGRQVTMLGQSVFARYRQLLGVEHEFPEEGYKGGYIEDVARAAIEKAGDKYKDATYDDAAGFFVEHSLDMLIGVIKADLEAFSVRFDTWQSERELFERGAVQHAIDFLSGKGLMYEEDGALWFAAERFGDDKNRVVKKQDGQFTYFASDIAYHLNKVERGFDEVINIWGADHHGYVPRLEAVMDALGAGRDKLRVLLVQMVSLLRGGQPVQMSKRAGEFITLRELIDEVGADITKFIFLTRRHDSQLTFDLEVAKASTAENPVFYVQYAGARINSLFAKAADEGVDTACIQEADLSPLADEDELRLIRKVLSYSIAFEQAARSREPHRITFYLQELAALFHPFYNKHRVIGDNVTQTRARLALCMSVRLMINEGLEILGISAPERM